jgi:hypothetical protein
MMEKVMLANAIIDVFVASTGFPPDLEAGGLEV